MRSFIHLNPHLPSPIKFEFPEHPACLWTMKFGTADVFFFFFFEYLVSDFVYVEDLFCTFTGRQRE